MSDEVEMSSGISRRQMIKRGAIVGGTLMWAAPVVQSVTAPAFALYPAPEQVCCRFTGGGGSIEGTTTDPDLEAINVVHFGFELHCGTPPPEPNNFAITFEDTSGRRVTFHLEANYQASCFPPPTTTPNAPCSEIRGSGTGRVTGPGAFDGLASGSFATLDFFRLVDVAPESGNQDIIELVISYTNAEGQPAVFQVSGNPRGNIQAHRVTGSKGC